MSIYKGEDKPGVDEGVADESPELPTSIRAVDEQREQWRLHRNRTVDLWREVVAQRARDEEHQLQNKNPTSFLFYTMDGTRSVYTVH